MGYIGREPQVGNFQVCDAISVVNGQAAYTMQVGSVNVSPETANHMIVSLNGVLQKPGSSFTVSGSTITFASNLVTGDVIDFIHILGSVLDLGVPSDDTVTAAKASNNFISGQTELATAPADTDEFLVSDAGTLKRIDYSLIKGGGSYQAQQWRITTSFDFASEQDINSNWEISDSTGYGSLGSNLTESSGKFSFPSTGIYLIMATFQFRDNAGERQIFGSITATTNNSSYSKLSSVEINNSDVGGGSNTNYAGSCQGIIDCTDTSNVKFALSIEAGQTQNCKGDTSTTYTGFICIRLGDT